MVFVLSLTRLKNLNSLRLANLSFHAAQVQKEGMLRFRAGSQKKIQGHSGEPTQQKRITNIDTRVGPEPIVINEVVVITPFKWAKIRWVCLR